VTDKPAPPADVLDEDELERFTHSCSHERRSPTTQRIIDAASYGWIHHFIRFCAGEGPAPGHPDWLDPGTAYPDKLAAYFSRVATRLHDRPSGEYAMELSRYFDELAASMQAWPQV
jgi:hypothetical protein